MDETKNFEGDEMSTVDLQLCQKITKHLLTLNSPRTTFLDQNTKSLHQI